MRLKTRYRNEEKHLADEIPAASEKIRIDGVPAADAIESPAVAVAVAHAKDADEATLRLQHQLADLQRAQALQHRAMLEQRIPNHTEKFAMWKAQGMSDGDHNFLASNPDMVANDQLTAIAANQAAQEGLQRDSDAHRHRTRELFDRHLRQMHSQAPTPEFFQPKPPPEPSPERERGAIFSAPVSREVPSGGYREPSPASIRLSREQKEAAALAGISEVEYARQLSKLGPYKKMRGVEHE